MLMRFRAPFTSNDITIGGGGSTVVAAGKLVGVNCGHHWHDNTVTTSTLTGDATFGGISWRMLMRLRAPFTSNDITIGGEARL